jgi:hypothetical protein
MSTTNLRGRPPILWRLIRQYAATRAEFNSRQVAEDLGIDRNRAQRSLSHLAERGELVIVSKAGIGAKAAPAVYREWVAGDRCGICGNALLRSEDKCPSCKAAVSEE